MTDESAETIFLNGNAPRIIYPDSLREAGSKIHRARVTIAGQGAGNPFKAAVAAFAALFVTEKLVAAYYMGLSFAMLWETGLFLMWTLALVQMLWWVFSVHVFMDRSVNNYVADILTLDVAHQIMNDSRTNLIERVELEVNAYDAAAINVLNLDNEDDWVAKRIAERNRVQSLVNSANEALLRQGQLGSRMPLSELNQASLHIRIAETARTRTVASTDALLQISARQETDEVDKT